MSHTASVTWHVEYCLWLVLYIISESLNLRVKCPKPSKMCISAQSWFASVFSCDTVVSHILKSSTMLLKSVSLKFAFRYMWLSLIFYAACYTNYQVISRFPFFFIPCQVLCIPDNFNCTLIPMKGALVSGQSDTKHTNNIKQNFCQSTHIVSVSESSLIVCICMCVTNANVCLLFGRLDSLCHMCHVSLLLMVMWILCCLSVLSHCNKHTNPLNVLAHQETTT